MFVLTCRQAKLAFLVLQRQCVCVLFVLPLCMLFTYSQFTVAFDIVTGAFHKLLHTHTVAVPLCRGVLLLHPHYIQHTLPEPATSASLVLNGTQQSTACPYSLLHCQSTHWTQGAIVVWFIRTSNNFLSGF